MDTPAITCMAPGIIQHELVHVLGKLKLSRILNDKVDVHIKGFYHEQSRPDRDQYVSIQWANIESGTFQQASDMHDLSG